MPSQRLDFVGLYTGAGSRRIAPFGSKSSAMVYRRDGRHKRIAMESKAPTPEGMGDGALVGSVSHRLSELLFRRRFGVVDDHNLHGFGFRFQLQAELLLNRGED